MLVCFSVHAEYLRTMGYEQKSQTLYEWFSRRSYVRSGDFMERLLLREQARESKRGAGGGEGKRGGGTLLFIFC